MSWNIPFLFVCVLVHLARLDNRNQLGTEYERRSSLRMWCQMPDGLPCSASRVAGEISALGRSRIRPCGLTAASHPASRFARLASTSRPGRSAGLRSSLFWPEAKTIPPLHPSPASGRGVCLLVSGKPTVKHTHMSAEAYPPDGPQISPPQGSQNFSARAVRAEVSAQ